MWKETIFRYVCDAFHVHSVTSIVLHHQQFCIIRVIISHTKSHCRWNQSGELILSVVVYLYSSYIPKHYESDVVFTSYSHSTSTSLSSHYIPEQQPKHTGPFKCHRHIPRVRSIINSVGTKKSVHRIQSIGDAQQIVPVHSGRPARTNSVV